MSNINNWGIEGEDTESLDTVETTEEVLEVPIEDMVQSETKSEKKAKDLNLEASVSEDTEDDVAEEKGVISSKTTNSKGGKKKAALTANNSGVISSGSVVESKPAKKSKLAKEVKKVAIFSTKNVTWNGVGKVYRGYNFVPENQADKWLSRDHVRSVAPEEISRELGE